MTLVIKDNFKRGRDMGRELLSGLMGLIMRVNSFKVRNKVKENSSSKSNLEKLGLCMKANSNLISEKEKVK